MADTACSATSAPFPAPLVLKAATEKLAAIEKRRAAYIEELIDERFERGRENISFWKGVKYEPFASREEAIASFEWQDTWHRCFGETELEYERSTFKAKAINRLHGIINLSRLTKGEVFLSTEDATLLGDYLRSE